MKVYPSYQKNRIRLQRLDVALSPPLCVRGFSEVLNTTLDFSSQDSFSGVLAYMSVFLPPYGNFRYTHCPPGIAFVAGCL
jgi:hypothetical protein